MKDTASPVFIARVTEVYFDKKQPPPLPQSWLELRLFIPAEPPVRAGALSREYILQGEAADSYLHFSIQGIDSTGPEQLHRLCLLLAMVRDTFFDGLMGFIQTDN